MDNGCENLRVLARSPTRLRLLRRVHDAPATAAELVGEFEEHRRTVKRNLDSLVAQGWVADSGGEFVVTPPGRLFAEDLFVALDRLGTATKFAPFFESVSMATAEFPHDALLDCSITVRQRDDPLAPVQRETEQIAGASSVRSLAPVSSAAHVDAYADRLRSGARVEAVLAVDLAAALLDRHPERMPAVLESEAVDLYVYDGALPLGIVVTSDRVLLAACEDGRLEAVVEGRSNAIREWATATLERFLRDVRPLSERFGDRLHRPAEVGERTHPVDPTG